jgi:hypothetical protein
MELPKCGVLWASRTLNHSTNQLRSDAWNGKLNGAIRSQRRHDLVQAPLNVALSWTGGTPDLDKAVEGGYLDKVLSMPPVPLPRHSVRPDGQSSLGEFLGQLRGMTSQEAAHASDLTFFQGSQLALLLGARRSGSV